MIETDQQIDSPAAKMQQEFGREPTTEELQREWS